MGSYRVVQWSTGGVGALAVAAISRRPDLELVGVWVHSPDKVGRDAGELAGIGALGVRATSEVDEVLALAPDCICYTASGESRPTEAIDDFCRMLAAGINVVTTSVPGLLYPPGFDATEVARIETACRQGGSSLYVSGIEPGFAGDHLVLTLVTMSKRIRLDPHAGDLRLRALSGRVHDVRGLRFRQAARPSLLDGTSGRADQRVGSAGAVRRRSARRRARRDPRDLREAGHGSDARGRGGNDRVGHRRRGALRDDRCRRRTRRDRDRTRQPHGARPRARLADAPTATARTGSRSTASPR